MDVAQRPTIHLTWANVGIGVVFILFNASVSTALHLGVCKSLFKAAFGCITELINMGNLLQGIFNSKNPWAIGGFAFGLNLLSTFMAVVSKAEKRHNNMFPSVLLSMLGSTIPVSIIGVRYAMTANPFWTPEQYIPVVGVLCGSTISGIASAAAYVLEELCRDKVETYLAFGASRFEACLPIAREALRLALAPTISQMSVVGIISMPDMMIGTVVSGTPVAQAAKLQMIIMFMISASTSLAAILTTAITLSIVIDGEHRIRPDRIDTRTHPIMRGLAWVWAHLVRGWKYLAGCCYRRKKQCVNAWKRITAWVKDWYPSSWSR